MSKIERSKKLRAVIELISFVAFALISKEIMDLFMGAYSGPVSLITTLLVLSIYMHFRGEKWSSMGLQAVPGTKARLMLLPKAMLIFITVLVSIVVLTKGLEAMGLSFMSETPEGELERWGNIEGNVKQYLILIGLSWISAGFAEEMFFRGFVITRLQTAFHGFSFSAAVAVVLSALLFGYVHFYYQGLAGFVNAGLIGLIFALFFLRYKRNLWPLILAHGFINSLGFTADFMGWGI